MFRKQESRRDAVRRQFRQWRAAEDLSQLDTAERAGLTREKYWRIENGYDVPTSEERAALAKAFRIPRAVVEQAVEGQVA